jgi:hypothetical protein
MEEFNGKYHALPHFLVETDIYPGRKGAVIRLMLVRNEERCLKENVEIDSL